MTTTTTTTTTAVDRLLEVVAGARPAGDDVYAADATFDAVVPGWRFAVHGAERIGYQLAEWFPTAATLEELERHPTPGGEVVTYTVTWDDAGSLFAARHVHVLTVVDDRIVSDQVWCGGRWSSALLAEMEAAGR